MAALARFRIPAVGSGARRIGTAAEQRAALDNLRAALGHAAKVTGTDSGEYPLAAEPAIDTGFRERLLRVNTAAMADANKHHLRVMDHRLRCAAEHPDHHIHQAVCRQTEKWLAHAGRSTRS